MTNTVLTLGSDPTTLETVEAVARSRRPVAIDAEVLARLARDREVVERFDREGRPVYGLTRGLGGQVVKEITGEERDDFSRAMVFGRAGGAGPALPQDAVRAALFSRIASMARGGSGVRPALLEQLVAMLNAGVHPVVPSIGSVGAADIVLMANMALPVMGEGRAVYRDEILPGAEALRRAGLEPLMLAQKEGLALCSANAVSTGLGALALHDGAALLELLESIVVLTYEAFRANPSPLDERVVAARSAPGQAVSAAALRAKLVGSGLFETEGPLAPRRVQDPISLRCVSQIHGASRVALEQARVCLEVELNGAGDNPLVVAEDAEILSNGNFHTPATVIAFDALALALHQVASISANRAARLMKCDFTGLPDRLSTRGPSRIGVAILSMTAATLVKEIRDLAQPASLDNHSGYDVEDDAPMTPRAVRKVDAILGHLQQVMACELIVAAQAYELRQPSQASPVAERAFAALRDVVPFLDDDRATVEDIERATDLIASGALAAALAD